MEDVNRIYVVRLGSEHPLSIDEVLFIPDNALRLKDRSIRGSYYCEASSECFWYFETFRRAEAFYLRLSALLCTHFKSSECGFFYVLELMHEFLWRLEQGQLAGWSLFLDPPLFTEEEKLFRERKRRRLILREKDPWKARSYSEAEKELVYSRC